ncbi:MAG: CvpA family protein [Chitinophagales bacterium]|nr:CvpA family protein [Chitinophagales bacterium]HAE14430.1 hypothetical protein [Bacteroidota bacterium]MCB9022151.1 CvpA family protein [Chitinophagales bacterium]MCB9031950.1 CvpA family protein [Chitinophagales bacterium]HPE97623.1 CvpA family protein [Chitinophagales bacterium]
MILDVFYAGVLLVALFRGYSRGLIFSLFWLLSVLVGIAAAVSCSHITATYLEKWFHLHADYMPFISFLVTMFLIGLVFRLLGRLVEGVFQALQLNFLNKLAGAFVWMLSWTLVYSSILWYGNNMGVFTEELKTASKVYEPLVGFAPAAMDLIGHAVPLVRDVFEHMQDWFDKQNGVLPVPETMEV